MPFDELFVKSPFPACVSVRATVASMQSLLGSAIAFVASVFPVAPSPRSTVHAQVMNFDL